MPHHWRNRPREHYFPRMNFQVKQAHGEGGGPAKKLIEDVFLTRFRSVPLHRMMDASVLPMPKEGRLAVTTQTSVVRPVVFPGGDIGRLAVLRAVNNLTVVGAQPRLISVAFVLEEGLSSDLLERVVASMARASAEATVEVVAGDTRVVAQGEIDRLAITVTAFGVLAEEHNLHGQGVREGDVVIINGPIAEHGAAVIATREGSHSGGLASDARSLHQLARIAFESGGVRRMTDISRGGLAGAVIRMVRDAGVGVDLKMEQIPLRPEVQTVCEEHMLDPVYVPAAGVLTAITTQEAAPGIITKWRRIKSGQQAAIIGRVKAVPRGEVALIRDHGSVTHLELKSSVMLPQVG